MRVEGERGREAAWMVESSGIAEEEWKTSRREKERGKETGELKERKTKGTGVIAKRRRDGREELEESKRKGRER